MSRNHGWSEFVEAASPLNPQAAYRRALDAREVPEDGQDAAPLPRQPRRPLAPRPVPPDAHERILAALMGTGMLDRATAFASARDVVRRMDIAHARAVAAMRAAS